MRYEHKFIRTISDVNEINAVMETDTAWGWQVINTQVIDKTTVVQGNAVSFATSTGMITMMTQEVVHTKYSCITYKRDMEDSRYKRWTQLEEKYEEGNEIIRKEHVRMYEAAALRVKHRMCKRAAFAGVIAVLLLILFAAIICSDNDDLAPLMLVSAAFAFVVSCYLFGARHSESKVKKELKRDPEFIAFLKYVQTDIIPKQDALVEEGLNL